jgi:hypothetical protein
MQFKVGDLVQLVDADGAGLLGKVAQTFIVEGVSGNHILVVKGGLRWMARRFRLASEFKVGDTVRTISPCGTSIGELGSTHQVQSVDGRYLRVVPGQRKTGGWFTTRFELVKREAPAKVWLPRLEEVCSSK